MVNIGEQYYNDAASFNTLVADFSTTCNKLIIAIQNMVKAINEVNISNSEQATGTHEISESPGCGRESSKGPGTYKCNETKLRKPCKECIKV